jgi:hypothetical protein
LELLDPLARGTDPDLDPDHQAKIERKTLISTVDFLMAFYLQKEK